MQPEKNLRQDYFIRLVLIAVFSIIMMVSIIAVAVSYNSIMGSIDNELSGKMFFYGLITMFLIGTLVFVLELIKYGKDFNAAKNSQFKIVMGKVLRFANNRDTESGRQVNSIPIIQISGSDETIKLKLNERTFAQRGGSYTFIYLQHTKMGAVKTDN